MIRTKTGGFFQQESFDGKVLYFLDGPKGVVSISDVGTLMRMPWEEASRTKVLEGIRGALWGVTQKGIVFVTRDSREDALSLYQFEDSKVVPVGSLPFRISGYAGGMSVSADGRWLLTNQMNRNDTDLMLIENFK